ncbi:unnamed protein product [Mucor hiemalis]
MKKSENNLIFYFSYCFSYSPLFTRYRKSLQSPFYFMVVNIVQANATNDLLISKEYLSGSTVSSLYRLRDIDNTDGGFFVFGDLAVKKQGHFKLHFSLFELIDGKVENRKTLYSNDFMVYTAKKYPGPIESTFLSRTFSDQGIKMRVRKEHRTLHQKEHDPKSRTNSRKRKYDIPSSNNKIIPKEILSPPSYASDNAHFGRWQSSGSARRNKRSNSQSTCSAISSPTYSHLPPPSLPSPPPSITSTSPTLLYLPPINISNNTMLLPPPPPVHPNLEHKWMMLEDDNKYHPYRLPPLREIMNNKHASESYNAPSLFPIDNSFFRSNRP